MIKFKLTCHTEFGQNLFVRCDEKLYPMKYSDKDLWTCEMDLRIREPKEFTYVMQYADGSQEHDTPRRRFIPKHQSDITLIDTFSHRNQNSVFGTKAFLECINKQYHFHPYPVVKSGEAVMMVYAPTILPEHGLAVSGEETYVGAWNPDHKVRFMPTNDGWWWVKLPVKIFREQAQYKFVVYDRSTNDVILWEEGGNRKLPAVSSGDIMTTTLRATSKWRGTGVSIPVFSIRTKDSWGIGEFNDLKKMGDWAASQGHRLIQILPINDTTSTNTEKDSYPYRANSVHALHPMYLHIPAIGNLKDKKKQAEYEKRAKELNNLPRVDYVAVNKLKREYVEEYYGENYNEIVYSKDFKKFVKDNDFWIKDYAVFCCIRDKYGHDNFQKWNDGSVYSVELRDKYIKFHKFGVSLYYFAQFKLHQQLLEAIDYLHSIGIVLKGDLPIGVSPRSADAWVSPKLFNLEKSAGAPPDDFSVRGQNWGFPTYNWAEMAKDNYAWWKSRFMTMDRYFDAFRIDHILGFFRIWEIPNTAVWGLLGNFNPALPYNTEEMQEYGIKFDRDRFTKPYITKEMLKALFADDAAAVTTKYFTSTNNEIYSFKQNFSNQRKLMNYFIKHKMLSEKQEEFDKLMSLYCEVIFIEDSKKKGFYHPRINMFDCASFSALPKEQQIGLVQLHDNYYYHRHNDLWKSQALKTLPSLIQTTEMLVCGEDLGMVPECVQPILQLLQILSLEVQRMPKDSARYVDFTKTPYLSVACTGTHDTSTIRSWWRENANNTQFYYNNVLNCPGEAPKELSGELAKKIIDTTMNSTSMWTINPWQDYIACDEKLRYEDSDAERINDPSDPDQTWNWRMHITL